jgi:hypothetical protein
MGRSKLILLVSVALSLSAQSGAAQSSNLQLIAGCTGRLSAQMEQEWSTDTHTSNHTKRSRNAMADVLAAMITRADGDAALAIRIQAKHAHRRLLQRGAQAEEQTERARAVRLAAMHVRQCLALLPGPGFAEQQLMQSDNKSSTLVQAIRAPVQDLAARN